eukprot:1157543-Pelagomonas_calceolata.AAC.2
MQFAKSRPAHALCSCQQFTTMSAYLQVQVCTKVPMHHDNANHVCACNCCACNCLQTTAAGEGTLQADRLPGLFDVHRVLQLSFVPHVHKKVRRF